MEESIRNKEKHIVIYLKFSEELFNLCLKINHTLSQNYNT